MDYTLKTSTPAFSDDPREADDRIREAKAALVERLDVDHYFEPSATSTYDAVDTGKHRQVTFVEPTDLTSMSEDEGALFSKDVSSVAELHWIDESDNVLQITSEGYIFGQSIKADSIGSAPIQLENDTYLKAANAAGDGEVNLIKADDNDVAVVPDGTQMATEAAPTSTTGIANKKYVDDQIASAVPDDDAFGAWASKSVNTVYEAATDGVVHARGYNGYIQGFTDSNNPPTTERQSAVCPADWGAKYWGFSMHVRKGDYWKVSATTSSHTVYWLPIGG